MSIFGNDQELSNLRKEVQSLRKQVQDLQEKISESKPEETTETVVTPQPVIEEPVKEEPIKEEPIKEEPVKEEPIKNEVVKEVVAPQPVPDNSAGIDALKKEIAALAEKIDTAAYQEGIIRDLHEELQDYKKGLIADISKSYVMDIVRIYDRLADTNSHFNPEEEGFNPAQTKRLIENTMLAITDMLEDQYSIESFNPAEGAPYNPKEYKAMQVVETDDEAKASTIMKCLAPGFRNTDTGKLVRQARVVVYKRKDA